MTEPVKLGKLVEEKLKRRFNDLFWSSDDYAELFILELNKDSNLSSFGRKLDNKGRRESYKINANLNNPYRHPKDDALQNNLKHFVLTFLPKSYHNDHLLIARAYGYGMVSVSLYKLSDIDINKSQVMEYIENEGFVLDKETLYNFEIYSEGTEHTVVLNGKVIYYGASWDYHNGCHGCKIPDFRGVNSYVNVLSSGLRMKDYKTSVTHHKHAYAYEENL